MASKVNIGPTPVSGLEYPEIISHNRMTLGPCENAWIMNPHGSRGSLRAHGYDALLMWDDGGLHVSVREINGPRIFLSNRIKSTDAGRTACETAIAQALK